MAEKKINGCAIRIARGDITALDGVDAFVYDARSDLALGSGYGGAIAVRGGPSVQEELKKIGRCEVGNAVVTAGGKMKAKFIVHAVGPHFQEADEDGKLRQAALAALRCAEEKGIRRLAFPPMCYGFYGFPLDKCARILFEALREHLGGKSALQEVVICLKDTREVPAFDAQLQKLQ